MSDNDQSARAGDGIPVSLLEAIDYALNQAPCDCPHKMRFERGEHMSGCYLFDLNVEYAKAPIAADPATSAPICQHRRYSLDKQEQVGHCMDCGAEGRMVFVAIPSPVTGEQL